MNKYAFASDDYIARCEKAVEPLTQGKKITVELALLADNGRDAKQWMIDLRNAITEFHDPSSWKVSVVVRQGEAIASAKEVLVS